MEEEKERSNIHFKIISENLTYTISMKEQLRHGCFFPGLLDFFILLFLSLSEPCLWFDLSAHMNPWANVSSYAPLGPLEMSDVAVGPTKLGRNQAWTPVLPMCLSFKAWMMIWHLIENQLNLGVILFEFLSRETQQWKSFCSNKENVMGVENTAREKQK